MIFIFILIILFAGLTIRRLYIRAFWIATTAHIKREPSEFGQEFMGIGGALVLIEYETDEGLITGECKFPTSSGGEGVASSIRGNEFWRDFVGTCVPVYYHATLKKRVVFIGNIWCNGRSIRITKGNVEDWVYAFFTLVSIMILVAVL